ncbi:ImmA/IrrE family metallo-endopeptidase [Listeria monocytogenes]|nr:ImmA/IrrE family metallo-endopeptidase [Listeria monocytogenes]ECB9834727.1 ImmA/IrrE family metallo-endopeptidase [Listeria monocytogenes]
MAVARIAINPDVVSYYIQTSDILIDDLVQDNQLKNITEWLNLTIKPTFNQLNQLSKKIKVPFGYLLLNEVQSEENKLINYRTILNNDVSKPSRDLLDTISDMEEKQNWMVDYLIRNGYQELSFIGSTSANQDVEKVAATIRKTLDIEETWYLHCSFGTAFNYLRKKFEKMGILVMQNGVVKANTHRPLNIDEFRAFALVNAYAPLIFINSTDSFNGKIFSLFHEVVHIFLGENDLFNDNHIPSPMYRNETEIFCNAVASELCISTKNFKTMWSNINTLNHSEKIQEIAQKCRVSILVIAVKALKNNYIDESMYYEIRKECLKYYKQEKDKTNRSIGGGNGLNTAISKIDKRFFHFLSNDIKHGHTQYTEAFRLLNTNRKTYDKIEKKILEG